MALTDETLMAFADGELDEAGREGVERALREDPEIARRIARHRALRARVQDAFAAELQAPVPERLLAAARSAVRNSSPGNVVDLQQARSARTADSASSSRPFQWRPAGALAASLLLGLGLGFAVFRQGDVPLMRSSGGALVAQGELDRALSQQLVAEQPTKSAVHIGMSFMAKAGDYCRSFSVSSANSAGVACRHDAQWQIDTLVRLPRGTSPEYRTAATEIPPLLRQSIEAKISGDALDAAAESAAQQHGWH